MFQVTQRGYAILAFDPYFETAGPDGTRFDIRCGARRCELAAPGLLCWRCCWCEGLSRRCCKLQVAAGELQGGSHGALPPSQSLPCPSYCRALVTHQPAHLACTCRLPRFLAGLRAHSKVRGRFYCNTCMGWITVSCCAQLVATLKKLLKELDLWQLPRYVMGSSAGSHLSIFLASRMQFQARPAKLVGPVRRGRCSGSRQAEP